MNKNKKADIPGRLRRLRPVAAPPKFETILYGRIRALRPRTRYLAWFTRPVPVALMVATGALLAAAYFVSPYHIFTSSPVIQDATVKSPTDDPANQFSVQPRLEKAQVRPLLAPDSLSADSASERRNDVNTSKMP